MVFRTWRRVLGSAGLTVMMVTTAAAQAPSLADKQFVRQSIETNNAEIAAAHLALKKTSSNDVKQFAMRMIEDHTKLNEQMRPIASKLDVEVAPGQVTEHQQELANQLKELKGAAFDQQYIAAMVKGHTRAVSETKTEIANSNFPPVKKAAQEALPVIEEHLQLAHKLAKSHNVQIGAP